MVSGVTGGALSSDYALCLSAAAASTCCTSSSSLSNNLDTAMNLHSDHSFVAQRHGKVAKVKRWEPNDGGTQDSLCTVIRSQLRHGLQLFGEEFELMFGFSEVGSEGSEPRREGGIMPGFNIGRVHCKTARFRGDVVDLDWWSRSYGYGR